jgi:hypothetical protein
MNNNSLLNIISPEEKSNICNQLDNNANWKQLANYFEIIIDFDPMNPTQFLFTKLQEKNITINQLYTAFVAIDEQSLAKKLNLEFKREISEASLVRHLSPILNEFILYLPKSMQSNMIMCNVRAKHNYSPIEATTDLLQLIKVWNDWNSFDGALRQCKLEIFVGFRPFC